VVGSRELEYARVPHMMLALLAMLGEHNRVEALIGIIPKKCRRKVVQQVNGKSKK
jgi:hypothetical protein